MGAVKTPTYGIIDFSSFYLQAKLDTLPRLSRMEKKSGVETRFTSYDWPLPACSVL